VSEYTGQQVGFEEEDLQLVYEGLWNGTKLLNTRSKFNHAPRLLFSVVSKVKAFQIGDIDQRITITKVDGVKGLADIELDISKLISTIKDNLKDVQEVEYIVDPDLKFIVEGKKYSTLVEVLSEANIPHRELTF
jgi:CRISPR-associated protein Csh2